MNISFILTDRFHWLSTAADPQFTVSTRPSIEIQVSGLLSPQSPLSHAAPFTDWQR
jgi:hypothetical protein